MKTQLLKPVSNYFDLIDYNEDGKHYVKPPNNYVFGPHEKYK